MFTKGFGDGGNYVCDGDRITCTVDGFDVTARIVRDDSSDRPDERQDGFWPSLNPKDAGFIGTGKTSEDLDAAQEKAQSIMDAWERDEWWYVGVVLSVERKGITLDSHAASLWGIECNYPDSDNAYLGEVANELLDEALDGARVTLRTLCDDCDEDEGGGEDGAGI